MIGFYDAAILTAMLEQLVAWIECRVRRDLVSAIDAQQLAIDSLYQWMCLLNGKVIEKNFARLDTKLKRIGLCRLRDSIRRERRTKRSATLSMIGNTVEQITERASDRNEVESRDLLCRLLSMLTLVERKVLVMRTRGYNDREICDKLRIGASEIRRLRVRIVKTAETLLVFSNGRTVE